jgi:hypothetical protein
MPRTLVTAVLAPSVALALTVASPALACPACPTARLVAQAICAGDLWLNIAVTVAPFVVFAIITAGLHRLGRTHETAGRR